MKVALKGKVTAEGKTLRDARDTAAYLLETGGIALVPFYAFGSDDTSDWFRLSVGTATMEGIEDALERLRACLEALN